jgi:hypothetical protein|tara:strand:- start:222 stop:968 length:747 start_codon:yes stop_codon:yes gene_type:complete
MNKNLIYISLFLSVSILPATDMVLDPSFQFDYISTEIDASSDSIGSFNGTIHNLSSDTLTLAVVRSINELSEGWTSSICVGTTCYNESVDSVSVVISALDSIFCGILAWTNGTGDGLVQLSLFDQNSPDDNINVDVHFYFASNSSVADDRNGLTLINGFELNDNYPNPFNPITNIDYYIFKDGLVNIMITDITGKKIIELENKVKTIGHSSVQWDSKDHAGRFVSSGIYFYTIEFDKQRMTKSMVLTK